MPADRDFNATVLAVIDAIPAEESALRAQLEHVRYSAMFQAPEAFRGWHEASAVLTSALSVRADPWCDRVYEVWTGRKRDAR